MNYDVIVAGAGSAGGMTAYALAKKGFDVALIDRKSDEKIGKKHCGDAIGRFHFDEVQKTGLHFSYPSGEENKQTVKAIDIYSPNLKTRLELSSESVAPGTSGFLIDRHLFGQRIKNYAVDSGANLLSSNKVKGFIVENETVKGVKFTEMPGGETKELSAQVVIDATGANTVLRKKVPPRYTQYIEKDIDPFDMAYAYREIREVDAEIEFPERLRIIYDGNWVPAGYIWIFQRNDGTVNAGLGGAMDRTGNLKEIWQRYMETNSIFEGSKLIEGGSGKVPTRRPLDSMVADNFALVGDAGAQVNPLHAGGLGVNIEAAVKLADTVERALESGDTTVKGLWNYNVNYMRTIGAGHAPLDLFRHLIASLDNNAINKIMRKKIVGQDEILRMATPEGLQISFMGKLKKLFKAVGVLRPTLALAKTVDLMQQIKRVYQSYPEIDGFQNWIQQVKKIYAKSLVPKSS